MQFARVYYSKTPSSAQVKAGDLYFAEGRALLVFSWRRNGTIFHYEGEVQGKVR